jgi:hypothetical protein
MDQAFATKPQDVTGGQSRDESVPDRALRAVLMRTTMVSAGVVVLVLADAWAMTRPG